MAHLTTLYFRWRYLVLLGTLLLVLVVQPISFGFSTPLQLFDAFLMLVTVALLLSFCPDKNRRFVALAFGIPTGLLSQGGHLLADQHKNSVVLIGHCLAVGFYFCAAVLIVASLFRRKALSLDSVFGMICGYLLLGMVRTVRSSWSLEGLTTDNSSWRRTPAAAATCPVEKWRLLGHPSGPGELVTGVQPDPPRAGCCAFPAGFLGWLLLDPFRRSPGCSRANGRAIRTGTPEGAVLPPPSSTMTWRPRMTKAPR